MDLFPHGPPPLRIWGMPCAERHHLPYQGKVVPCPLPRKERLPTTLPGPRIDSDVPKPVVVHNTLQHGKEEDFVADGALRNPLNGGVRVTDSPDAVGEPIQQKLVLQVTEADDIVCQHTLHDQADLQDCHFGHGFLHTELE